MRMEPVTVHLPRNLKRWLEKEAKKVDQTLASYVRRVLKLHQIKEEETHGQADATAGPPTGNP